MGTGDVKVSRGCRGASVDDRGFVSCRRDLVDRQRGSRITPHIERPPGQVLPSTPQRNQQARSHVEKAMKMAALPHTTSREPESRLEVDIAKFNHMRAGLHEPAANDREIVGRAQLNAQAQVTTLQMTFELFCLVGSQPIV
jgi:hypothetical protein